MQNDEKDYDRWFLAECIPIFKDKAAVAHKHLDLYTKGESIGEPTRFTFSTMVNCEYAIQWLADELVEEPEVPIPFRRTALFTIVQQYSDANRIGECVAPEVIKQILTCYDDDSSFWVAIDLIECLLLKRNRDFFTSNGIDFAEILNAWCGHYGVEQRAFSNDDEMFACIDELRQYM